MKFSKFIFAFLLLAVCFSECKKYSDGPWLSLRSKKARVIGEWIVESFTVNGIDSTSQITCKDYTFGPHGGNQTQFVSSECPIPGFSFSGGWIFSNHHKDLNFRGAITGTGKIPFFLSDWEIQRLTEKQMWLKSNYNGKEYYIKLNRQ